MKTMKKYFKVAICFLAFAVCSFLLAFSPTMTAMAAIDYTLANYNLAINSMRMPTSVINASSSNAKFLIPLLDESFDDAAFKQIVRVVDPSGTAHDYEIGAATGVNTDPFFGNVLEDQTIEGTAKTKDYLQVKSFNNGDYKIIYILKSDDNVYYSNTYTVTVKGVSCTLDFTNADNSKIIFPTMKKKDGSTLTLPTVNVKNTETNAVAGTATVKVYKNNKLLTTADDTDDLNGNTLTFSADTGSEQDVDNIYTITYSYDDGSNHLSKTFRITASNSFEGAKDLQIASTPSMPTIRLGQTDVTLPKLSLKNSVSSDVDYNLESIVVSQQGTSISQELGKNDYTFDMTPSAFGSSVTYEDMFKERTYNVKYKVKDAYGNTLIKEYSFELQNPQDPTVYMSYDYDVDADGKVTTTDINLDASAEIKSAYGVTSVIVPAIYGTDAIHAYESDDFVLVRYLYNTTTRVKYYVDNIDLSGNAVSSTSTGYNHSDSENVGNPNKAVNFKFTASDTDTNLDNFKGKYELRYAAVAKAKKNDSDKVIIPARTTDKVMATIQVLTKADAEALDYTPTIKIDNIINNSYVTIDKDIDVKVVTNDAPTTSSVSKDYSDKNLKTVLMYYYGAADSTFATKLNSVVAGLETGYNKYSHTFDSDMFKNHTDFDSYDGFTVITDSTNNTFKFAPTDATKSKVTIVVATINDQGVIATDSKTLNIKDTSDVTVPDYTISYDGITVGTNQEKVAFAANSSEVPNNIFEQDVEVVLPKVTFDDTDEQLELSVAYYIVEDASKVGKVTYNYPQNPKYRNGDTIIGGIIKTDKIGTYNVVYTATDIAGNTSAVFVTFKVGDSSNPILNVTPKGDIEQSGKTITAEIGTEISFENLVYSSDRKNNLTDKATINLDITSDNLGYTTTGTSKYSYTFNSVGSYTVEITASYYDDVFDETRYADPIKYVINIEPIKLEWVDEFDKAEYEFKDKSGEKVYLPKLVASHGAEVSLMVKTEADASLEVTEEIINGKSWWVFTPAEKGIYKVTYTAVSDYATDLVMSFDMKVGDHVAPTISINYETELKQDIVYKGKDINYTFDVVTSGVNKKFVIKVTSNGKTIYEYNLGLNISDRDENGQVSSNYSWSDLKYTLTTENGKLSGSDKEYTITGTGKYVLTLSIKDKYNNETTKTIEFNVIEDNKVEEEDDSVVGTVLIIISLVVLAGVIGFFTFTGKKSKGTKTKKTRKSKKVAVETKDDEIIIEDTDTNDKAE